MKPGLTPLEALKILRVKDEQTIDGWYYYLDAPQRTPDLRMFYPIATKNGRTYAPRGELGDEITETTRWILCD